MKTSTFLLPLLVISMIAAGLFAPAPLAAQSGGFPHLFTLDSRSADTLFTPEATSTRHRYRITAWGTYSMWEDTVNSSVDPVWIYSFPEEEWAKPEWRLFTEGYPIYVGDSRMFDSHGLRVDDSPFPKLPLNDDHRYSTVIQGTGSPVSVAIVDWNFRGLQKQDAHENNSGYLYVLVEELPLYEAELCAVDSSDFPNVRVSLNLLRDSVRVENLADLIDIYENGLGVSIDSVDCDERTRPVSVALVLDRSGSMSEPWGTTTRLEKVQESAHGFVDRLADSDEGALFTFGTDVTLDQEWTNNRGLLHDGISNVEARGYTAMNDAVDRAIRETSMRPDRFRRAVVLLSDGEDNISQIRSVSTVIQRAVEEEIPVFTIGLLYQSDDSLRLLANSTGGRHFSVSDPGSIDSVFASIAELLFEKGCCNIWYRTPREARDGTWRTVETELVVDGDTLSLADGGYRSPGEISGVGSQEMHSAIEMSVTSDWNADYLVVAWDGLPRGRGELSLVSVAGETVVGPVPLEAFSASGSAALPVGTLPVGTYFVRLTTEGGSVIRKVPILR